MRETIFPQRQASSRKNQTLQSNFVNGKWLYLFDMCSSLFHTTRQATVGTLDVLGAQRKAPYAVSRIFHKPACTKAGMQAPVRRNYSNFAVGVAET